MILSEGFLTVTNGFFIGMVVGILLTAWVMYELGVDEYLTVKSILSDVIDSYYVDANGKPCMDPTNINIELVKETYEKFS